ncbi:MAG: hypothetical protein ACP5N7_06525 [Candidatus Pacearchaeota archaeon]
MTILWRASAIGAVENQEYFNEQQTLLNKTIALYLDELMPERQIDRVSAVMNSKDKMKKLVKKNTLILNTSDGKQKLPKPGKSIKLGKQKNGNREGSEL